MYSFAITITMNGKTEQTVTAAPTALDAVILASRENPGATVEELYGPEAVWLLEDNKKAVASIAKMVGVEEEKVLEVMYYFQHHGGTVVNKWDSHLARWAVYGIPTGPVASEIFYRDIRKALVILS